MGYNIITKILQKTNNYYSVNCNNKCLFFASKIKFFVFENESFETNENLNVQCFFEILFRSAFNKLAGG